MEDLLDDVIFKLSYRFLFRYTYVDNILTTVLADKQDDILGHIKSYDPNLQFTIEGDTDFSVPWILNWY